MNRKGLAEEVKTGRRENEEVAGCQEAANGSPAHIIEYTITQK
jgi:hypothetical protein